MAFCTKCGTPLADDARFCSNCGSEERKPLQEPEYQQPQYEQPVYPQPVYQAAGTAVKAAKAGSAVKWIIALALLAGAAALVFVFFGGENLFKSDEQLILERVEALETAYNSGDWEGILDCLDGPTRSAMELTMGIADGLVSGLGGFDLGITDLFGLSGLFITEDIFRLDVKNIQIDGKYAMVTLVMGTDYYGFSQAEEVELPMVKEDGDWYIGGIENLFGESLLP